MVGNHNLTSNCKGQYFFTILFWWKRPCPCPPHHWWTSHNKWGMGKQKQSNNHMTKPGPQTQTAWKSPTIYSFGIPKKKQKKCGMSHFPICFPSNNQTFGSGRNGKFFRVTFSRPHGFWGSFGNFPYLSDLSPNSTMPHLHWWVSWLILQPFSAPALLPPTEVPSSKRRQLPQI